MCDFLYRNTGKELKTNKVTIGEILKDKEKYILHFEYGTYDNFVKARLEKFSIMDIKYLPQGIKKYCIQTEMTYKKLDGSVFTGYPMYYVDDIKDIFDQEETYIEV